MKITCFYCGKIVSNEISDDIILRGIVECPECAENKQENAIELSRTESDDKSKCVNTNLVKTGR